MTDDDFGLFCSRYVVFGRDWIGCDDAARSAEETQLIVDELLAREGERLAAVESALSGVLPFDSSMDKVVALGQLLAKSRVVNGDRRESEVTLSLAHDFGCALHRLLHEVDPEITWRFQRRAKRAVSFNRPVLARDDTFEGDRYIDAIIDSYAAVNFAFMRDLDPVDRLFSKISRLAESQFQVDVAFPECGSGVHG
ncbi:hypothetical protein CMUST_00825 [Corynebacterium mustelae]|uniref:Uncharacterized protein n=1 Tax=Corynebacterium mustelae TaxID=571915 RepID=A0A0G3GTK9_9CORY|nr:hypothetical protein [Corynebacterium mustelae]AKK04516.1 hypothetical protein CMUST_00825 [Corynebacterium mustelae]